ncbi:hypothetical protein TMUPMC115_0700 [Tetragenococcus muriaticus PMC-11-5]|uniref:Uncharacterized protein n=1 Tax=Tetragenococcus muriaticus PMC-11-5 TaxID=1302649 RepID=A0A091C7M1_9ENTE|nr:hypothetical protein TMUPMC115_0700 [Tetragenococcus muriaticus PMC-11-5]
MSEQTEIEFKTLLTRDDYNRLTEYYQLSSESFYTQKIATLTLQITN